MPRNSRTIFIIMGVLALIMCSFNLNTLRSLTNVPSAVEQPAINGKMTSRRFKGNSTNINEDRFSSTSLISNISTMAQTKQYKLTPLSSSLVHSSQYTIRMNTWRRNEQLLVSINNYAKCEGVAQIQIIWCDMDNEPPLEVTNHTSGKVAIERHTINSLNERYNITTYTSTLGILSMDDDILRPCEALDATFIRWTRNPDRIVGFYARSHLPSSKKASSLGSNWTYNLEGPENQYSITLPSKMCFIHRDYLDLYVKVLPRQIYHFIDRNFNCEDISMSFFVSALTGGRPPLLGDHWAVRINMGRELYSNNELSRKKEHADTRNSCVHNFAELLGLKQGDGNLRDNVDLVPLKFGHIKHEQSSCFGYGDEPECWSNIDPQSFAHAPRLQKLVEELKWRESIGEYATSNIEWFDNITKGMEAEAKKSGLIKSTFEWDLRWSFKCPVYFSADNQTKYCAAIKPMKFRKDAKIPICDITHDVRFHASVPGMTTKQYASYLDKDLPCNVGGCADCLLNTFASVKLCTVVINSVNSTLETGC